MIISRTPFRISFFGGGTDYPAWYREHGGSVLGTTIDKYCYLSCRHLPPFFEHRIRVVYSKIELCQRIDEIQHPSVREVLRFCDIERGIEVHHDGDLPARAGIGSSSAFTVGLLNACYALKGEMVAKHQLAMESIHLEQDVLQETVGSQDQVFAAYGGLNQILFDRNGEVAVRPLTLPQERVEELNGHLMLFFTGILRTASDVAQTYVNDLDRKRERLKTMRDMVDEGIAILSDGGSLDRFGRLLHESWKIKRGLGGHVTNGSIEALYQEALSAGALGGKITGAGGGGFMLLFVRPEDRHRLQERLRGLLHVPFRFEPSGSHIVFYDPEKDYAEEERARASGLPAAFREMKAVLDAGA